MNYTWTQSRLCWGRNQSNPATNTNRKMSTWITLGHKAFYAEEETRQCLPIISQSRISILSRTLLWFPFSTAWGSITSPSCSSADHIHHSYGLTVLPWLHRKVVCWWRGTAGQCCFGPAHVHTWTQSRLCWGRNQNNPATNTNRKISTSITLKHKAGNAEEKSTYQHKQENVNMNYTWTQSRLCWGTNQSNPATNTNRKMSTWITLGHKAFYAVEETQVIQLPTQTEKCPHKFKQHKRPPPGYNQEMQNGCSVIPNLLYLCILHCIIGNLPYEKFYVTFRVENELWKS